MYENVISLGTSWTGIYSIRMITIESVHLFQKEYSYSYIIVRRLHYRGKVEAVIIKCLFSFSSHVTYICETNALVMKRLVRNGYKEDVYFDKKQDHIRPPSPHVGQPFYLLMIKSNALVALSYFRKLA